MELTEAQKLLAIGITTATLLLAPLLFIVWRRRKSGDCEYPAVARVSRFILFACIFKELMSGIMHLFFPYDCHRYISHLPQGLGIPVDDRNGAFTGLALLTIIQGGTEIAFSLLCAIPFLVKDEELMLTTYVLVVGWVTKLLVQINVHTDLISGIHSHLPGYMRDKRSMEYITKSPPGAHVGLVEMLSLAIAVVMAVIGMKQMKCKVKKGEDEGKKIQ